MFRESSVCFLHRELGRVQETAIDVQEVDKWGGWRLLG
jgi:hypothetical protein